MKEKKKKKKPDYLLLIIICLLVITGILILTSVSIGYSLKKFGNTYYFFKHQILFGLIPGLILAFIVYKLDLSFIRKIAPILLLINLAIMFLVFIPGIGLKAEGASRWIQLGPISFQPSEFLKISFILYLAAWLSGKDRSKKHFVAFMAIVGLIAGILIKQPDASTLIVIGVVAIIMYFSNDTPIIHNVILALLMLIGLFLLSKYSSYHADRITVFLNPDIDPMGKGFQIRQSLISVGSGGLLGSGLGLGIQKFGSLPQPISDSIFAIFSEEAGFVGTAFLVLLFVLFFWRGISLVKRSNNKFNQLTALGITSWIIIQAFVNIGAMIRIFPLTGIPLPFVSYGGTSMIVTLVGTAILLNISKSENKV